MPLEGCGVQCTNGDGQSVPAVVGDDHSRGPASLTIGLEGLPQMEHVGLDGARGPSRDVLSPQRVGQLVDR